METETSLFQQVEIEAGPDDAVPPTFGRFALNPEKNICAKEGEKEMLFFGGVKAVEQYPLRLSLTTFVHLMDIKKT